MTSFGNRNKSERQVLEIRNKSERQLLREKGIKFEFLAQLSSK